MDFMQFLMYNKRVCPNIDLKGRNIMKIKHITKPLALIGAAALLLSAAGCADTSWSFKTSEKTLSNGAWIYYTNAALSDAVTELEKDGETKIDITKDDISSKKIDDKNAIDWINDKAKDKAREYLTIEKLCNEYKLEPDKESAKNLKKNYTSYFDAGYMDMYKELGVSAETFTDCFGVYQERYEQLFDYVYGKEGPKAVSDDELKKYFKDNYTSYYYIQYSLKNTDPDDSEKKIDVDDDTKDKVKLNFSKYAKELNEGKAISDIEEEYKTDFEVESVPSTKNTEILKDSSISEELQKEITALEAKKATIKVIDDTEYLIYKGDLDAEAEELIKEASEDSASLQVTSHNVLHGMKSDEFKTYLEEQQKQLKAEENDACFSKYSVQRTIDIVKKNSN